jgi:hypothetical protein
LTPSATTFRASISSPESVSSITAKRGCNTAIWNTSLRFFSPPEKPSLTERLSMESSIFHQFHALMHQFPEVHRVY